MHQQLSSVKRSATVGQTVQKRASRVQGRNESRADHCRCGDAHSQGRSRERAFRVQGRNESRAHHCVCCDATLRKLDPKTDVANPDVFTELLAGERPALRDMGVALSDCQLLISKDRSFDRSTCSAANISII